MNVSEMKEVTSNVMSTSGYIADNASVMSLINVSARLDRWSGRGSFHQALSLIETAFVPSMLRSS